MYTIQSALERKLKLCILPTCKGKRYDLVHKFPMNNERALQWIDIVDVPELKKMPLDKVRKRYFICSKHFRQQDYKNCESRSLNTTAYPRLHLKLGEDEPSEQYSSNVEGTTELLTLQDFEFGEHDAVIEISGGNSEKISIDPPCDTAKNEKKTSVQYVVCSPCSPTTNVPILLRKNRNNQSLCVVQNPTHTISQSIAIKSPVKLTNNMAASSIINILESMPIPNKFAVKRNSSHVIQPAYKKPNMIETDSSNNYANDSEISQNDMPAEKDGLLFLHHNALESPLKVCSLWLRDHCRCINCYGETFQRKFNIAEIPLDVKPTELKTENNFILVTWSDGHESSYDILELSAQLNTRPSFSEFSQFFWSTSEIESTDYANVTLNDYLCNDEVAKDVVASLIKFGCAFIKNVPANLQSTEIAVRRLFPIQKTIFGEMWSFSDNKAHNDTAYTTEALPAHNDNTYFSDAAGLQILHCISRASSGGDNLLVDGFYVLKKLREQNTEAYEYLSQVSIPSEYIEDGYHFKHNAPVIMLDPLTKEPNQIRFNMNDRACFNTLPQEAMMQFYKHYMALAREIQLPANEWRFKLEPGTVCIFDNWRILHGRSEFSGRRQMVGCYVARSEFLSVARRYGMIS